MIKSLWCIHKEFSYKSVGERIVKIGPHLPKLYQTSRGILFWDTVYFCHLDSAVKVDCENFFQGACFIERDVEK